MLLFVAHGVLVAQIPCYGEMFLGLGIVLIQELQHSLVVLENDLLRLRDLFERRHVASAGSQGSQHILAQVWIFELEVSLEKKVADVVDAPLPRL